MACTNCKGKTYTTRPPDSGPLSRYPKPCYDCTPKMCPDCNHKMIHRSDSCKLAKIYWCVHCRAEWQKINPKESL